MRRMRGADMSDQRSVVSTVPNRGGLVLNAFLQKGQTITTPPGLQLAKLAGDDLLRK